LEILLNSSSGVANEVKRVKIHPPSLEKMTQTEKLFKIAKN